VLYGIRALLLRLGVYFPGLRAIQNRCSPAAPGPFLLFWHCRLERTGDHLTHTLDATAQIPVFLAGLTCVSEHVRSPLCQPTSTSRDGCREAGESAPSLCFEIGECGLPAQNLGRGVLYVAAQCLKLLGHQIQDGGVERLTRLHPGGLVLLDALGGFLDADAEAVNAHQGVVAHHQLEGLHIPAESRAQTLYVAHDGA
jgi:hypothetical protein